MIELWGGHECTVNRVGDTYADQTRLSGHEDRIADLDLFASLGCRALRYPVLWERVSPDAPDIRHWAWSDARLARLRALNIRPIVGLVHHGAGPAYTQLLDPSFAAGLARHAQAVAERYPWIDDWTPVNEPLTTARFSALYGHWHPHATNEGALWTALLNQIDGVRLSMLAIRRVNPSARLIQTEDLGRTYGTAALGEQVAFDNLRRWLTWDLLTGRVDRRHPLHRRLAAFGLAGRLDAIADEPCRPDVLGVNHYLTSERFLDERIERYPVHTHGGNGSIAYADVEAVRVLSPGPDGLEGVLREAHQRYGLPLAITEVHNGCTREEQMRWLLEAWRTAQTLSSEGVDLRAVTAWSLLGSFGWNDLLRTPGGDYEPGVFDLRGGAPRPTGLASLMQAIVADGPVPAVADGQGWWRRDIRLEHPPVARTDVDEERRPRPRRAITSAPLIIAGATTALGRALVQACYWRGLDCVVVGHAGETSEVLNAKRPWAVIDAAVGSEGDRAQTRHGAGADTIEQALALAHACLARNVPFVAFSNDRVFDGASPHPYREHDPPSPVSAHGRGLAALERRLLAADPSALIVRSAALFSAGEPNNFASALVRALRAGEAFNAGSDLTVSPTHTPELADAILDLLIDGASGIVHLTNQGPVTWARFARMVCERLGLDAGLIQDRPISDPSRQAARRRNLALTSTRGHGLSPLEAAVDRFAADLSRRGEDWAPAQ